MIDKNDPKLTAFALGELTGSDFDEVEAEVNSNTELQAEVESIKKVADEVCEILLAEQYLDIVVDSPRKVDAPPTKRVGLGHYVIGVSSTIIVACVITVTIILLNNNKNEIANISKMGAPTMSSESEAITVEMPQLIGDVRQDELLAVENTPVVIDSLQNEEISVSEIMRESKVEEIDNDNNNNEFLLSNNQKNRTAPFLNSPPTNNTFSNNIINNNINQSIDSQLLVRDNHNNNYNNSYNNGQQNFFRHLDLSSQNMQRNQFNIPNSNASSTQIDRADQNVVANSMEKNDAGVEKKLAQSPQSGLSKTKKVLSANIAIAPKTSGKNHVDFGKASLLENLSSYDIMRQSINDGKLPPASKIKIDEYVNNFRYNYSDAKNDQPFVVQTNVIQCPWNKNNLLASVGIKMQVDRRSKKINVNINDSSTEQNENSDQHDDSLRVVVKFDKSKIKDYLLVNRMEVGAVSDSSGELTRMRSSGMVEDCDLNLLLKSSKEVMLLYELVPASPIQVAAKDERDLNKPADLTTNTINNDYFTIELKGEDLSQANKISMDSKQNKDISNEISMDNKQNKDISNMEIAGETQFAAAVALCGLLLQDSEVIKNCDWDTVKSLVIPNINDDEQRKEFLKIIEKASKLMPKSKVDNQQK